MSSSQVSSSVFDEALERLDQALTLPAEWYTDRAIFEQERQKIFGRSWQFAGHISQAKEPGQYFTHTTAGISLIIARDDSGELRAYHNVCRHRGMEIVQGPGRRKTLQCQFHGWTWGLDGCLRGVPREAESCAGFDRADYPLYHASVDTWGPFIFVNPDPMAEPLSSVLGELPEIARAAGLDIERATNPPVRRVWELKANWKLLVENFLECYHCQLNHPSFTKLMRTDAVLTKEYDWFSLQLQIPQGGEAKNQSGNGHGPFSEVQPGSLFAAVLWPTYVFNVYPGLGNVSTQTMIPVDVDRSLMVYDYFLFDGVDHEEAREFIAFWDQVQEEDKPLVEGVQRGLQSGGVFRGGPVFNMESIITHFERLVLRAMTA